MSSPHVGIWLGICGEDDNKNKKPRRGTVSLAGVMEWFTWVAFTRLYQAQFFSPFDRRPSTVDVEFAVDALGMGADRA